MVYVILGLIFITGICMACCFGNFFRTRDHDGRALTDERIKSHE
jgi:hypothetical protein